MNNTELQKFKQMLKQQREQLMAAQKMAQNSTQTVELDQSSVIRVSHVMLYTLNSL